MSDRIQSDRIHCRLCGSQFGNPRSFVISANACCVKCAVPYSGDHTTAECGCKRHLVKKDKAVLYQKEYWSFGCLSRKLDRRLEKILTAYQKLQEQSCKYAKEALEYRKIKTKFARMKKFIKGLRCDCCKSNKAGNRFVIIEDKVYCGLCALDDVTFCKKGELE